MSAGSGRTARAVTVGVLAGALALTGCSRTVPGRGAPDGGSALPTGTAQPTATAQPTGTAMPTDTAQPTGTATPTGGPTGTAGPEPTASACPGAGAGVDGVDLGSALPTTTPRRLPVRPDRSGPQSLDQIVGAYEEADRGPVRRDLVAAGFREGYWRTWAAGTAGTPGRKVEVLLVYRFGTPAGACRYSAAEAGRSGLEPIPVADVPGSVGVATRTGEIRTAVAQATKGPYVIIANALSYTEPVDFWTVEVVRAAYRAL